MRIHPGTTPVQSDLANPRREASAGARIATAPPMHGLAMRLRQGVAMGGDALVLVGVVFALPFVILAIGIPIALFVQLLLWIGRLL